MWLILTMFGYGLLHGLGSDHLVAITTLTSRERDIRKASTLGLRFGVGHMLTLSIASLLALWLDWRVSPELEKRFEVLGGLTLIILGTLSFVALVRGRIYVHEHAHKHDLSGQSVEHTHRHIHFVPHQQSQHKHTHLSLLLGGVFALSGIRALLVMIPTALAGSFLLSLIGVLFFGLGIILSMTACGYLAVKYFITAARIETLFKTSHLMIAIVSVALGAFWIYRNSF